MPLIVGKNTNASVLFDHYESIPYANIGLSKPVEKISIYRSSSNRYIDILTDIFFNYVNEVTRIQNHKK